MNVHGIGVPVNNGGVAAIVGVLVGVAFFLLIFYTISSIHYVTRTLSRETLNQALEQCSPNGGLLKIEVGLNYSTVTCHNNMTARIPNK